MLDKRQGVSSGYTSSKSNILKSLRNVTHQSWKRQQASERAESQSLELITKKPSNADGTASLDNNGGHSDGITVTYDISQSSKQAAQRKEDDGLFENATTIALENDIRAL